jgi:hypothetical protein
MRSEYERGSAGGGRVRRKKGERRCEKVGEWPSQ